MSSNQKIYSHAHIILETSAATSIAANQLSK